MPRARRTSRRLGGRRPARGGRVRGRGAPLSLRPRAASGSAGCASCSRTPRPFRGPLTPPRDLWPGIARARRRASGPGRGPRAGGSPGPWPRRRRSWSASAPSCGTARARSRVRTVQIPAPSPETTLVAGDGGRVRPGPGRRRARLRGGGERAARGAAAAPGRACQPEALARVEANLAGDRPGARRGAAGPRRRTPPTPSSTACWSSTHRKKVDVLRRVVQLSTAL